MTHYLYMRKKLEILQFKFFICSLIKLMIEISSLCLCLKFLLLSHLFRSFSLMPMFLVKESTKSCHSYACSVLYLNIIQTHAIVYMGWSTLLQIPVSSQYFNFFMFLYDISISNSCF